MVDKHEMEHLFDQFMDELEGYCEYRKCAEKNRESAPTIADKYAQMSEQELKHAGMIIEMMRIACDDNDTEEKRAYGMIIGFAEDRMRKVTR